MVRPLDISKATSPGPGVWPLTWLAGGVLTSSPSTSAGSPRGGISSSWFTTPLRKPFSESPGKPTDAALEIGISLNAGSDMARVCRGDPSVLEVSLKLATPDRDKD